MKSARKGDKVKVLVGKHQGYVGVVTEVKGDGKVVVQIAELPYERTYPLESLEFHGKVEPVLTSGESRRRRMQKLIREKKMCPSWPHCCTGDCGCSE